MVGDKELDTGLRCWSCKEFTTLRARIAELEARIVWLECELQVNAAPVSEAKAQDTVGEVVGWYRLDRPYEMTSYPSVCATWHKLGAPVAPLYAAPVQQAEYGDAYQGAREDLAIWKRRTLEAEEKVRQQEQIIDHLTSEAQGESRFGEPVVTPDAPCVPDGYVLADKKALGTVLQALVNAPHHIRELQVTRQPVELFSDNPINVLIANYEAPAAPVQHPDDAAVDRFAVAMKAKLAASREKGRHGWQNATAPHLSSLLHEHMYKGDPLDVGNLAMMLHQNGQAIELPHDARRVTTPVQQVSVPDVLREAIKWADHLCFECGALVQTRAPSVHVYNKTFEAVQAAKAMLAASPAAPAADAGLVEAIDWLDDFVARCNGDDRGSCDSVNVIRAALAAHCAKGVV